MRSRIRVWIFVAGMAIVPAFSNVGEASMVHTLNRPSCQACPCPCSLGGQCVCGVRGHIKACLKKVPLVKRLVRN